jgi:protein TonB
MEISAILTADILDIVFEGKNKEYGAYELRRTYRKRLSLSIAGMLLLIGLFVTGYLLAGSQKTYLAREIFIPVDTILRVDKPPQEIIPPKPIELPKQATTKFDNFRVVKDDQVKPDEKPPEVDKLEDTKIGTTNVEGTKDDGIVAPPVDQGNTGVTGPVKKEEEDWERTFIKVEKESEYPGGIPAWLRFLHKNLNYPQVAQDNEIQGTVVVRFIVDKEGNVSDVEAISGPTELRDEAVRVIKKSGKWTPAVQNGRQVKSYKSQPITFQISSE